VFLVSARVEDKLTSDHLTVTDKEAASHHLKENPPSIPGESDPTIDFEHVKHSGFQDKDMRIGEEASFPGSAPNEKVKDGFFLTGVNVAAHQ